MRGSDPEFYYNCYCQINGVEDKISYTNELYQLYQELKARKRNIVIVNGADRAADSGGDRKSFQKKITAKPMRCFWI